MHKCWYGVWKGNSLSLHLLSNLYSWQPGSHTSTTVCVVVNRFWLVLCSATETLMRSGSVCFSLFCLFLPLQVTVENKMSCCVCDVLLLFHVIEFLQLMFVTVKPQLCSSRSCPCPRPLTPHCHHGNTTANHKQFRQPSVIHHNRLL